MASRCNYDVSNDIETSTDVKASFTASIDKWLLETDGSNPKWMDGPSIKLYKKDDLQSETITHVVTVDTGTNSYRTENSIYYIDGEASPSLDLKSGKTYEFDISGFSGHPFYVTPTRLDSI